MTFLLEAMREHLIAEGLVRKPTVAGALPPLWLEPRLGTPAPGEGNNATAVSPDLVIGAEASGGVLSQRYQGFFRFDGVEFTIRARTAPLALTFESNLRALINDVRQVMWGDLLIIESLQFRPLQPLGRDEQSYDWNTEYLIQTWQPGAPDAP